MITQEQTPRLLIPRIAHTEYQPVPTTDYSPAQPTDTPSVAPDDIPSDPPPEYTPTVSTNVLMPAPPVNQDSTQ